MFDFAGIFTTQVTYLPYRLLGMMVVLVVLGGGITLCLRLLGERGPQYDGRASLNPFTHLDWGGLLGGVLLRPGWAAPVKLRAHEVRFGLGGILLAVLAPIAVLFGLAYLLEQLRPVFFAMMGNGIYGTRMVLRSGFVADLFVWCALVNLIPLPPFLMGHIWAALAPALWQKLLGKLGWLSLAAFVLVLSGAFYPLVSPLAQAVINAFRI